MLKELDCGCIISDESDQIIPSINCIIKESNSVNGILEFNNIPSLN